MTTRKSLDAFKGRQALNSRLAKIIRLVYAKEAIPTATVAWLKSVEPEDLISARLSVASETLDDIIVKSTRTRLFAGDKSLVPLLQLHDDVVSSRLGLDLHEELGEEPAVEFLQNLAEMTRLI